MKNEGYVCSFFLLLIALNLIYERIHTKSLRVLSKNTSQQNKKGKNFANRLIFMLASDSFAQSKCFKYFTWEENMIKASSLFLAAKIRAGKLNMNCPKSVVSFVHRWRHFIGYLLKALGRGMKKQARKLFKQYTEFLCIQLNKR